MTTEPPPSAEAINTHWGLDQVAARLGELERELLELEAEMSPALEAVPATHRDSAKNLVHYVALRQRDLRALQAQLAQRGLSSLGRSESCVMGGLLQVSMRAQESLVVQEQADRTELDRLRERSRAVFSWEAAQELLHAHTLDLFGPGPADRQVYVMVTAPSAGEADREWMVRRLTPYHDAIFELSFRIDAAGEVTMRLGSEQSNLALVSLNSRRILLTALQPDESGGLRLGKLDNLVRQIEPGTLHKVVVEVRGKRILVQLDDKLIVSGESPGLDVDKTKIGLAATNASASFDYMRMYEVASK